MNDRDRGSRRLALRIKPGSEASRKRAPRKLFLGVRFKETSAFLCPTLRTEDQK